MKKQSLGRGLGAILGEIEEAYDKEISSGNTHNYKEIEISKLKPNPYQPRKEFDKGALLELSLSIKEHGQLQPILVASESKSSYIIIAGERRFRAIKLLGDKTVSAIVIDYDTNKLKELSIIENIQREELNPIELATSYEMLIQSHKLTQEELSNKIYKSRTSITNTLRLLKLSTYVQSLLVSNIISAGHAKVMVGLNESAQKIVADTIKGQHLSVRETEKLINSLKIKQNKPKQTKGKVFKIDQNFKDDIISGFTQVGINTQVTSNKITLIVDSVSDTQKILHLLTKKL